VVGAEPLAATLHRAILWTVRASESLVATNILEPKTSRLTVHVVELRRVWPERLAAVREEGKQHTSAAGVAGGWATGAAVLAGLVAAFLVQRLGAGLQVWARVCFSAVVAGEPLRGNGRVCDK